MRTPTLLLLLSLAPLAPLSAQSHTRSYRIPGEEAWEAARSTGFDFHPVIPDERYLLSGRRDGVATTLKACDSPTRPCRVVARIDRGTLTVSEPDCEGCDRAHDFTLFDGRPLADGWTVRGIRLAGSPWKWIRRPAIDTAHLAFTVRVTAEPDRAGSVSVAEITLVGPAEADWRDAFARAP